MMRRIWNIMLRLFVLTFSLIFALGIWIIASMISLEYVYEDNLIPEQYLIIEFCLFVTLIAFALARICYYSTFSDYLTWIFGFLFVLNVIYIIYVFYILTIGNNVLAGWIFVPINSAITLTIARMFYLSYLSDETDKLKFEIIYVRTKWPMLMSKLSDLASEGDTSAFADLYIKSELKLLNLWHDVFNVKKLFILGSGTVPRKEKYLRRLDQERQWLKLVKETLSQTLEETCKSSNTLRSVYQSRRQENAIDETFIKAQTEAIDLGKLLN